MSAAVNAIAMVIAGTAASKSIEIFAAQWSLEA
jgi:hypothetical protein